MDVRTHDHSNAVCPNSCTVSGTLSVFVSDCRVPFAVGQRCARLLCAAPARGPLRALLSTGIWVTCGCRASRGRCLRFHLTTVRRFLEQDGEPASGTEASPEVRSSWLRWALGIQAIHERMPPAQRVDSASPTQSSHMRCGPCTRVCRWCAVTCIPPTTRASPTAYVIPCIGRHGDVFGDVFGDECGDVFGDVFGDVRGDVW